MVLVGFDGSVLTLVLPAIAHDFHARITDLSNLGSVLSLGSIGALPLATLADHFGRRRMIAIGVLVFSVANVVTAFVPSLAVLAVLRLVASCFEDLVLGVSTALIVEEAPRGRRGQAGAGPRVVVSGEADGQVKCLDWNAVLARPTHRGERERAGRLARSRHRQPHGDSGTSRGSAGRVGTGP